MTRPTPYEPAPPAQWMLPGLRGRGNLRAEDRGDVHPDVFDTRSARLAEQQLERERIEAQQRQEKEERDEQQRALAPLRARLQKAIRSKGLTEGQKNAVGEALAAVNEGRVDDALAILEEHT